MPTRRDGETTRSRDVGRGDRGAGRRARAAVRRTRSASSRRRRWRTRISPRSAACWTCSRIQRVALRGAAARSGRSGRHPDPRRQEPELAGRRADRPGRRRAGRPRRRARAAAQVPVDLRARPPRQRVARGGRARGPPRSSTRSSSPAPTPTGRAPVPTGCSRRRRGSSATGRTRISRGGSSASARRSSRSARR